VIETPFPQLVLEYLPLGSLDLQVPSISEDEAVIILHQSLLALEYLHENKIMHRDIKPANILVESREPLLHIKLADFGLSKANDYLETICGTHTYAAPEIVKYSESATRGRYAHAVDIWSLGVVIFELVYDLPFPGTGKGLRWCEKILDKLEDTDSDDLIKILSVMIVWDPKLRRPAKKLLRPAENLLHRPPQLPNTGQPLTPMPLPYSHQQPQSVEYLSTIYDPPEQHDQHEHQPALAPVGEYPQHEYSHDPFRDSEIDGYIRSRVSFHSDASDFIEERKRSTRSAVVAASAASSASSGKRAKKSARHQSTSGIELGVIDDPDTISPSEGGMAALLQGYIGERWLDMDHPSQQENSIRESRIQKSITSEVSHRKRERPTNSSESSRRRPRYARTELYPEISAISTPRLQRPLSKSSGRRSERQMQSGGEEEVQEAEIHSNSDNSHDDAELFDIPAPEVEYHPMGDYIEIELLGEQHKKEHVHH
jgi:serine/threonine protein kinase